MKTYLDRIRKPVSLSIGAKIKYSCFILILGIVMGIVSKMLDETAGNRLPLVLQSLDLRNFLSRMGFWMFCGICISVYSKSPLRAAANTLLFFAGMVGSYYWYTITVAGFFPKTYMMLWIAMTLLSPLFAAVCWYAKGIHGISLCIASVIIAMMARQAFAFGYWYFSVRYGLELLLWIGTIPVLYVNPKQTAAAACFGILLFFITSQLNLFWGMM